MAPAVEAAILADGQLSVRACARKHGVSYSYVGKIRRKFKAGAEAVSEAVSSDSMPEDTKKRVEHWLDIAEEVLASVGLMVKKAAEDPDTLKNPDMFRAVVGGAKIMSDAVNGRRYVDLGRNQSGDAAGSSGPPNTQGSGEKTNVTPIRAAG